MPKGQFGSRPAGGDNPAAPRYIFTLLQPITRYIFREEDDSILRYLNDDGQLIEPEFYVPIIPMVLCNGAKGIGTGWSTSVPQFNPRDLIDGVRRRIMKKSTAEERAGPKQLHPWYRGWTGKVINQYADHEGRIVDKFIMRGRFEVVDDKTICITELPPSVWTESYRDELNKWVEESMSKGKDKDKETKASNRPDLQVVNDFSDNDIVKINVVLGPNSRQLLRGDVRNEDSEDYLKIINLFNLEGNIRCSNMMLHDAQNTLKQYSTPSAVIDDFMGVRYHYYEIRKRVMLEELLEQSIVASEKARFIEMIVTNQLKVQNVPGNQLALKLWELKFLPQRNNRLILLSGKAEAVNDGEVNEDNADEREAQELLRKKVADVTDRDVFF